MLKSETTGDDLKVKFKQFGLIKDVIRKANWALIRFETNQNATDALNMNGRMLDGAKI